LRSLGANQKDEVAQQLTKLFQRDPQTGYAALAKAIEEAAPKDKTFLMELASELATVTAKVAPKIPGLTAEIIE
jgi:hypothetical protein